MATASFTYIVEQGLYSPREQNIGYRWWAEYPDLSSAMKEARRLGLARVVQQRIIHQYEDGKLKRGVKS